MNEKKKQPGFFSQLLLGFLETKATGSVIHHFKENKRKRDQEWHDTVSGKRQSAARSLKISTMTIVVQFCGTTIFPTFSLLLYD